MKYAVLYIFMLCFFVQINAQGLPNDCVNFIQVCGNYDINLNVSGAGVQEIEYNVCDSFEHNSLWLRVTVEQSGTLGFTLVPESRSMDEDYDFWVFGPDVGCDDIGNAIRCSTTNPIAAGQANNHTGLNASSNDLYEGPGPDGDSFLRWLDVIEGEEYFIVIDRPIGNSSFNLNWTGTAVLENPLLDYTISTIEDIYICDNDGDGEVQYDFSIWNEALVAPYNGIEITYHQTESDANYGSDPLSFPDVVQEGIYYARIAHINSKCFDIVPIRFFIQSVEENHNLHELDEVFVCDNDNDGIVTYDFSVLNNELADNTDTLQISYYTSYQEAYDGVNGLNFPDQVQLGIHYIRIVDELTGCFIVKSVNLVVGNLFQQYQVNQLDDIHICDNDGDGIETYDFSIWNEELVDDLEGFQISYYTTASDAADDNNALSYPAELVAGEYFVRIYHSDSDCIGIITVNLILENPLEDFNIQTLDDIHVCDNDMDGIVSYDFSELDNNIVDSSIGINISYHATQSDATQAVNALSFPDNITNGTYYVRITHLLYGCYQILPISIVLDNVDLHYTVNDLDPIYICDDDSDGFATYDLSIWNEEIVEESSNIEISYYVSESNAMENLDALSYPDQVQSGTYYVRIDQLDSGCYKIIPIQIEMQSLSIVSLEVINEDQINVITNYNFSGIEYSLDGGTWQSSNQFTNVSNGSHSVQISYGDCLSEPFSTYLLNISNVITPNGDGYNDIWAFPGLEDLSGSRLIIFDRYGKELFNISGDKPFIWDGTLQGEKLPSTSYWYQIILPDGREHMGHITLVN